MAEHKNPPKPIYKRREFAPLVGFFFLISFLLLSTRLTGKPPQIASIMPKIGHPGDVMVISGKYFGASRDGGGVVIAGYSPVSSGYLEWTENRISLRIPEEVQSGMVYVRTRNGKSNEILFTNREQIPVVLSGPGKPGHPYIRRILPESGAIGTEVTLTGMNFGLTRGESMVLFTWISGEADDASMIQALEYDLDYESWSDREIVARVPDGSSSGHLRVVTDKGESNAVYFEVEGSAGTKLFPEKRTYAVQYSFEIGDVSSTGENSLYIWVPQILQAPEQKGIMPVKEEPEPLFADVNGTKLFQFKNLEEGRSYSLIQSYMFDRYSIETKVNSGRVPTDYEEDRKLYKRYTAANRLVPSDHERILELGRAIVGRERNPYRKAKAIYNWVIKRLKVAEEEVEKDILTAIDSGVGDSYTYALLFCALARSVDIPSRPVAGYLVGRDLKSLRHYWAEFYLEKVGWVPVDPLLAEGKIRVPLPPEVDPYAYYFGNLDYNHLTFSKGLVSLNQMDPEGRVVRRPDIPSLQVFHEEAAGGLNSYSAYWSDLMVRGIY